MEKFDFNTINNFDEHIEKSIPGYLHLWELIRKLSSYFILPNTNVYDLGCSTGNNLLKLSKCNNILNVKYYGYDICENMVNCIGNTKTFVLQKEDITDPFITFPNASLILLVFSMQFLPVYKKEELLKKIHKSLLPGGALIICEKILLKTGKIQDIFTFCYYDLKQINFSNNEIIKKQYDLRSIMKNNTSSEVSDMLYNAGFENSKPFFQSLQFKGWLCIK